MREDYQKILDLLLPALRETRDLYNLEKLTYVWCSKTEQHVVATFDNGYMKQVNVSLDSGTAMIEDVVRYIV